LQNLVRGAICDQLNIDSRPGFHGAENELRSSAATDYCRSSCIQEVDNVLDARVDVILSRPAYHNKGPEIMQQAFLKFRPGKLNVFLTYDAAAMGYAFVQSDGQVEL
jgi:hypothetical protein